MFQEMDLPLLPYHCLIKFLKPGIYYPSYFRILFSDIFNSGIFDHILSNQRIRVVNCNEWMAMREQKMCLTCEEKWCIEHECRDSCVVFFNPFDRDDMVEEQEEKVEGKEVDSITEGTFVNQCGEWNVEKIEKEEGSVFTNNECFVDQNGEGDLGKIVEEVRTVESPKVLGQKMKEKVPILANEENCVDEKGEGKSGKVVSEEVYVFGGLRVFHEKRKRQQEQVEERNLVVVEDRVSINDDLMVLRNVPDRINLKKGFFELEETNIRNRAELEHLDDAIAKQQAVENEGAVVQPLRARRQVILDNIPDNDEAGVDYQKILNLDEINKDEEVLEGCLTFDDLECELEQQIEDQELEKIGNIMHDVVFVCENAGSVDELQSLDEKTSFMLEQKSENIVEMRVSVLECHIVYDDKPECKVEEKFVPSRTCLETDSKEEIKKREVRSHVHISLVDLVMSGETVRYYQNGFLVAEHDFIKNLIGFYACYKEKSVPACVFICETHLEYKSKRKRDIQKYITCFGVKKSPRKIQRFQFDPGINLKLGVTVGIDWLIVLGNLVYVVSDYFPKPCTGFSMEVFRYLWAFVKLSLVTVQKLCTYEFVAFGRWISQISPHIVDVTLMFDNGSVCLLEEAEVVLEPIGKLITLDTDLVPVSCVKLSTARENGFLPCKFQSHGKIKKLPFLSHGVCQVFDWCYMETEHICGRPLRIRFDKGIDDLYIADAYFGLMKVGLDGGMATPRTTEAEGVPFMFTNDLDIDEGGNI